MAQSKFLKHQDKNGDLLIDKCEVELPGTEEKVCLDCVPNPNAVLTDWKGLDIDTPRLNERTCNYEVAVTTRFLTTGGEDAPSPEEAKAALDEKYKDYRDEAINSLLDNYSKDDGILSFTKMREAIVYEDWDLEARPNSRLKLLYSVPFEVLEGLEEADEDNEDDVESGPISVSFLASELVQMNIRVRKGLNLYSRYAKVSQVLDDETLVYVDDNKPFDPGVYGDLGFSRASLMSRVVIELDQFLVARGYNLPSVGAGIFKDRVVKLKFNFTTERKLKKLSIFTAGCREKPIVFKGRKISALNRKESFKDKTAMGYLANLRNMDTGLTARQPDPFVKFLKDYTYPQIDVINSTVLVNTQAQQTAASCVGDALANEGKQIGQDILDEVLNIADVLAYQFHKNICKRSEEERRKEAVVMGESFDPDLPIDNYLPVGKNNPLAIMAKNQAFRQLETNDNVFVRMCGEMLQGKELDLSIDVRSLYNGVFDPMKICGLLDFMIEAIQCLFKGLTLEQALARAIQAALKAMSVENFGVLFVGLPADKQAELDALVKQKLESGNLFGEQTNAELLSDATAPSSTRPGAAGSGAPLFGDINIVKPWEDEGYIDRERERMVPGPYEGSTPSNRFVQPPGGSVIRRSLGKDYDNPAALAGPQTPIADAIASVQTEAKQKLSPDQIMEAYLIAIVEVYTDNLLGLVDLLNKFPGAEIISKVIALFDCPRPPLFTPSVMDFLKDIELPFCRNMNDITLPMINNPFAVLNLDILKLLADAAKIAIQQAIVSVLIKLMIKVCEIIGSAICKALETAGSIVAGLPEILTGRNTVKDILRESICGPTADEGALDDTIVDMYSLLGGAGAEMANRERVLALNEAIASSVTRRELIEASMGDPSESFLTLVDNLVEFEFPEFRGAFANRSDIGNFFRNFGNLLPAEFRGQSEQFLDSLDEDDELPANPSLCASPEQIEEFCSLRSQILDGRASPEQIAQLCRPGAEFGDIADIIQQGIPNTLLDALPPIVSDPGCSNGLFPYETEEQVAVTAKALGAGMDQLKVAFSYDMLGNGPGERNYGLMNMVLSDTLGRPYTAHQRKVFNDPGKQQYVDFHVFEAIDFNMETEAEDSVTNDYAAPFRQKGAYPVYIAEWMTEAGNGQLSTFPAINNDIERDQRTIKSFEDLKIKKRSTPLELPDYGYRVNYEVDYESEQVTFVEKQRKADPDIKVAFKSNVDEDDFFGYGLEIGLYVADLNNQRNIPADNARLKITEKFTIKGEGFDDTEFDQVAYEFLAKDNTLEIVSGDILNEYPRFLQSLDTIGATSPPIVLLSEMMGVSNAAATSYWNSTTKALYDQMLSTIMSTDNKAFNYGAEFDDLKESDADYLYPGEDVLYSEREIEDEDGRRRKINNKDAILGQSRDQLRNGDKARVIYLDPANYGGTYLNPPVYVRPTKNTGWIGLVDTVFPELSPCKPQRTEVIDFSEIESEMMKSYSGLSEDERLSGDPDCVTEVPYNRILSRTGKTGIQSVISAACRIHSVLHFIKSIATFSKFKPDFDNNFSDLYASFIVEEMEKGFKDAQQNEFFELFNPFKDEEFWYAFLEQSVQTYGRLLDEGEIIAPPEDVIQALIRLNNIQERYNYPDRKDLREAKKNDEVTIFKTLKNYRNEDALGIVKETEDIAKMVLKEFVKKELSEVANSFEISMKRNDFIDDSYATNIYYYILHGASGLTAGSQLNLLGELREGVADSSEVLQRNYTNGDEMALEDGTPYIGYYHTMSEGGTQSFMTGERHSEDSQDLTLFAKNIIVKAGSEGIGEVETIRPRGSQPFGIRAYLKTPTGDVDPFNIPASITSQGGNVSDVYPGTLSLVYAGQMTRGDDITALSGEAAGRPVVGLQGELGLRYGLEFYANVGGGMRTVTKVEVDVLDLPLSKLQPLEPSSKEMLCLINNLLDDDKFKLFMRYCLPSSKLLSTIAIYNDLAFLPSIGENVVPDARKNSRPDDKPGRKAVPNDDSTSLVFEPTDPGNPGWYPKKERRAFTPFVLTWDEWDQTTMRRTNSQLKKMFKEFYNSREFNSTEEEDSGIVATNLKTLREKFRVAPGKRILPWWKRRYLRSNPFNADEQLCENNDE